VDIPEVAWASEEAAGAGVVEVGLVEVILGEVRLAEVAIMTW